MSVEEELNLIRTQPASQDTNMTQMAQDMARILMKRRAVSINSKQPFVYASGITSPIYTDNRVLISYPDERERIVDAFVRRIGAVVGPDNVDVVAGTATAGIPWAAWIAASLRKPMIYVRSAPKEHGKTQQIEGLLASGQRAVLIEDLITTGASSLQAVRGVRQAGGNISHCFAIFTYEFDEASQAYADHQVKFVPLTTISTLLDLATTEGHISPEDREAVIEWLAPHRKQ